jgi:hypothetical protein
MSDDTKQTKTWKEVIAHEDVAIKGLRFELTCPACPEQYDVFDANGKQVGYVRLRHGAFRVDYPTCGERTIVEADTESDGCFETEEERAEMLGRAADAILFAINEVAT